MPSAASVKVEKLPANNSANNNVAATSATTLVDCVDNNSPIRQALVIIEHKIRNLEKRKGKLESYRDNERSGKELSADQKVAVSKYNEVAMTLEFAREFSKQIAQIVSISEKDLKKKQKKDETSRKQSETSKIREVLIIQDVVKRLSDESVRKDFEDGTNGACKLESDDLEILDVLSDKITPQRPLEIGGVPFKTAAQKSADILSLTIDGKQKDFETSSYAHVKNVLKNIQKCAYFDKESLPLADLDADVIEAKDSEAYGDETSVPVANVECVTDTTNANTELQTNELPDEGNTDSFVDSKNVPETFNSTTENRHNLVGNIQFHEAPCAAAVPVPNFAATPLQHGNLMASPVQQPIPSHGNANIQLQHTQVPPGGHQMHDGLTTTVRIVEQAYFKHHHQYLQQLQQQQQRPLAEVLGGSNFNFIQDSELDSPDVNSATSSSPATLHTNQSFPNVLPANIKPLIDMSAVKQFYGTPNAPMPISIVQPTALAMASPADIGGMLAPMEGHRGRPSNSPTSRTAHQQQPQSLQPANSSTNPAQILVQQQFSDANISASTIPISKISSSDGIGVTSDLRSNIVTMQPNDIGVEQRVPEITEWKPEDALPSTKSSKHHSNNNDSNGNNTWRDPYATNNKDSNEWNGGGNDNSNAGQDESNTWNSGGSGQRYPRYGPGNYGRSNRSGGNNSGRNNNNNGSNNGNASNTNGYRNRPSTNGSNTFYRNNDPYYQNGGGNRGGSADQKYRGRDSRGENTGTGSSSSYKSMPQRNTNQNANNNSNRLNGNANHRNSGNSSNAGRNPLSAPPTAPAPHHSTGINA